ncbi:universal stress protein [Dermatophilus congolensis]|uniref:universal stress protein n=1 Tax=Dermatophilus congolensis TaxID=1863 RepID=UPI001AAE3077|nr:universal stress protein [Dermatophilus congolensis]MBO3142495.1 universal stress protein [Dermatophilus congolensis]MBO3151484.1 universal stress protein [Dermatophilus congolensis]MBO3161512.1 universal stress protein [Dermatophilus congolensis]MBO3162770.1 universal stress protein [Dermatophilus congolensis]MBO3176324.1 universal stress protein [Dermatophilus congolensis]
MTDETRAYTNRIVVGYDGSPVSQRALTWAADAAEHSGAGLTVLTAVQLTAPTIGDGSWYEPATDVLLDVARRECAEGVETVRAHHRELDVHAVTSTGSPARLLIEASNHARMTVLGSHGRGEVSGLLLGSVSNAVAGHAHGVVTVVPESTTADKSAPVVVGVSDSPDGRAATRFAAQMASDLNVPLIAVRCWGALRSWTMTDEDHARFATAIENSSRAVLEEIIATETTIHPHLKVEKRLIHGGPEQALLATAQNAQLIVVGSRGRGGFHGLLMGSTSRSILHAAPVPVTVVHA